MLTNVFIECIISLVSELQTCRCGETGRRTGLKILRDLSSRAGSIPAICTKLERNLKFFFAFQHYLTLFESVDITAFDALFNFFPNLTLFKIIQHYLRISTYFPHTLPHTFPHKIKFLYF